MSSNIPLFSSKYNNYQKKGCDIASLSSVNIGSSIDHPFFSVTLTFALYSP